MVKLNLFFDVNKTILLKDSSTGVSTLGNLNSILSECTWGRFDANKAKEDRNEYDWKMCDPIPSAAPAAASASAADLVSFGEYLEDHTNVIKKVRKQLKTTYSDNLVGKDVKPYFDELSTLIRLPEISANQQNGSRLPSFLADGYYHILPSFFFLINQLVRSKVDFRIIFRTFGVDLANVVEEFNSFCEDRHPFFSPIHRLDGSHPLDRRDFRMILPHHSGKYLRTSDESSGLHFSYINHESMVYSQSGAKQIFHYQMTEMFQYNRTKEENSISDGNHYVFAFVDDFSYWDRQHESDSSGKVLLVDRTTPTNDDVIHIFFDDNIERNRAHIVDVRQVDTFEALPFTETNDKFIHKCEPLLAIREKSYFVNLINKSLRRFDLSEIDWSTDG